MVDKWDCQLRAVLVIQRYFRAWVRRRRLQLVLKKASASSRSFGARGVSFVRSRKELGMHVARPGAAAVASALSFRSRSSSIGGSSPQRLVPLRNSSLMRMQAELAGGSVRPSLSGAATSSQLPMRRRAGTDVGVAQAAPAEGGRTPAASRALRSRSGGGRVGGGGSTPGLSRAASAATGPADDALGDAHMWITAAATSPAADAVAGGSSSPAAHAQHRVEWDLPGEADGTLGVSGLGKPAAGSRASSSEVRTRAPCFALDSEEAADGSGRKGQGSSSYRSDGEAAALRPRSGALGVQQRGAGGAGVEPCAPPGAVRLAAVYSSALYAPSAEVMSPGRAPSPDAQAPKEVPSLHAAARLGSASHWNTESAQVGAVQESLLTSGISVDGPTDVLAGLDSSLGGRTAPAMGAVCPPVSEAGSAPGQPSTAQTPQRGPAPTMSSSLPPIRAVVALTAASCDGLPLNATCVQPPGVRQAPGSGGAGAAGRSEDAGPAVDGAQQLLDLLHLTTQGKQPQLQQRQHPSPQHGRALVRARGHVGLLAASLSGAARSRLQELPPLADGAMLVGSPLSRSSMPTVGGAGARPYIASPPPVAASRPSRASASATTSPAAVRPAAAHMTAGRRSHHQLAHLCVQQQDPDRRHELPSAVAHGAPLPQTGGPKHGPYPPDGSSRLRTSVDLPLGRSSLNSSVGLELSAWSQRRPSPLSVGGHEFAGAAFAAPTSPLGQPIPACPDPTASFDGSDRPGASMDSNPMRPVERALLASMSSACSSPGAAHTSRMEALRARGARSSLEVRAPLQPRLAPVDVRGSRTPTPMQGSGAAPNLLVSLGTGAGTAVVAAAVQHGGLCTSSLDFASGSHSLLCSTASGGIAAVGEAVSPRQAWAGQAADGP